MSAANRHGGDRVLAPAPAGPLTPLSSPPTFSIVIPAYQAAATIGHAVKSALEQDHRAHEVIVVDDGSTDDLAGAIGPFAHDVRLIRQTNRGGAAAHNAGDAVATGEFVVTLDADDRFHPRRLKALAELACARPDLDLITTDARFVVDGRSVGSFLDHNPFAIRDQRTAILHSCFVGGWPAVRRGRLQAIGGFDETLRTGYDWDCSLRLIVDGTLAGLVAEPYYEYVIHSGSLTSSRVSSLWDRVRLLEKAQANPALLPSDRSELARSLRLHRSRAVEAEAKATLFASGPRGRLLKLASSPGVDYRARVVAALAGLVPSLARRFVIPDQSLEERLSSMES
jgi:glycosyltransferase involved in cell wall biosynthesis